MTKNLHSIRKEDGTFIDCPNGLRLNPAYYSNASGAVVVKNTIPSGTVGNYTNAGTAVTGQSYADYAKEFGFSYTYVQAVKACPRSWHLPTNADWDLLAESMNGVKQNGYYPDIGHAMKMSTNKNFTSADGSTYNWTNDVIVIENGFNALPSGQVLLAGACAFSFSTYSYWWSATSLNDYRSLNYSSSGFGASTDGAGYYFSVRCVKN